MFSYDKSKINRLKTQFESIDDVDVNYSQAYQDMFVLTMLNGKKNGTFVEIGSSDPIIINNTFLLESKFGWNGISIDMNSDFKNEFFLKRKCLFILQNALTINYEKLFMDNNMPKQIDYLQIDIEPAKNTFECLKMIPFDKYRFSVITYETDYYDMSLSIKTKNEIRMESRNIFKKNGYELIVGNICNLGNDPFEDWYVDPNIVEMDTILKYKIQNDYNNTSESFILK